MDSRTFVRELEAANREALARLGTATSGAATFIETEDLKKLLQVALANEISVSELAAAWMPSTPEVDVKIALAQQAGDEAGHFSMVERRLHALGVPTSAFVPPPANPLFAYLRGLDSTIERIAAGQFTLESIAYQVNERFMNYCASAGADDVVKLYEARIQPDEIRHHNLGRQLLEKYAVSPEAHEKARSAAAKTIEIASQVRMMMAGKLGTTCFPGC